MGSTHPECPQRLQVIEDRLRAAGLDVLMQRHTATEARVEALDRVHDADYVRQVLATRPEQGMVQVDPDTAMNAYSAHAALLAAGAAVLAVDLVVDHLASLAFAAVRPPGHHAEPERTMGFCFFNNVGVAAAHALSRGLARVAILDFDVHYGNGSARMFGHDPRVLVCSTYQTELYPYWVADPGMQSCIDAGLPPFADGAAFRRAVEQQWLPAMERFQPELLLVSAGFDAHKLDPLSDMRLGFDDFRWVGEEIRGFAQQHCEGRVVATLEGGYNLDVLGPSVEAFLRPFVESGSSLSPSP
jgi:acetoin utilization deacetylase AcuC-like enzyme